MTKRPIEFKLDAYRMYASHGMKPIDAFVAAGQIHQVPLSGCMTTKRYASGYMSDDIKRYLRDKITAGDPVVLAYFRKYKLDTKF